MTSSDLGARFVENIGPIVGISWFGSIWLLLRKRPGIPSWLIAGQWMRTVGFQT